MGNENSELRSDFLEAFGITDNPEDAAETATEDPVEETDDAEENNASEENVSDEHEEDNSEEESEDSQNEFNNNTKANNAFAEMRVANRKQKELLGKVASVLGLNTNKLSENDLLTAVENAVVKAQSKQQGIPESVLQRLNTLEAVNQKYNRDQAYLAAGRGIQQIKAEFGATQKDLEGFMASLASEGINPFETPVNLVNEYKIRNFDKIVNAKVEAAVMAEQKRAAKATEHGTTPNNSKSASSTEEKPVNSLAELDEWLAKNSK